MKTGIKLNTTSEDEYEPFVEQFNCFLTESTGTIQAFSKKLNLGAALFNIFAGKIREIDHLECRTTLIDRFKRIGVENLHE